MLEITFGEGLRFRSLTVSFLWSIHRVGAGGAGIPGESKYYKE